MATKIWANLPASRLDLMFAAFAPPSAPVDRRELPRVGQERRASRSHEGSGSFRRPAGVTYTAPRPVDRTPDPDFVAIDIQEGF